MGQQPHALERSACPYCHSVTIEDVGRPASRSQAGGAAAEARTLRRATWRSLERYGRFQGAQCFSECGWRALPKLRKRCKRGSSFPSGAAGRAMRQPVA